MDFQEVLVNLEQGHKARRPSWEGYLFLDIDGNLRHAGKITENEKFWTLDINNTDWEISVDISENKDEIKTARIESLMDANSSHIKRLYYLEEIIEAQHKAFKKLADSFNLEMDETRKSIATIVRFIPKIDKVMSQIVDDVVKLQIRDLSKAIRDLTNKEKEKEKPVFVNMKDVQKDIDEKKEMEEVREKINVRNELKKNAEKNAKKAKKP